MLWLWIGIWPFVASFAAAAQFLKCCDGFTRSERSAILPSEESLFLSGIVKERTGTRMRSQAATEREVEGLKL